MEGNMHEIFRPMNRKSEVWAYFGFMKDANGQLAGLPVCNTCRSRVKTKDGNTTNLMNHLRDKHMQLYRQLKAKQGTVQDSAVRPIAELEVETRTTLFRAKILSLMESLMVKTTSEIVSIFDSIYMGAERELIQRRKEVKLLTQRLKEREQSVAENVYDNLPSLKLEPREEVLEQVLSHGVPERTETVEFALECVMLKAEEPVNSESVGQPPEYQLQLSHMIGAQQQPTDRADEELLGSPVWAAQEADSSLSPAGQAHKSDQETTYSTNTAELSSSAVPEKSTSPRPNLVVNGAPEPSQTDLPTDQDCHQPDGRMISVSSSAQHTSSPQALQTEDDVNAVGLSRKHRVRVRVTDFPSWQEFKKQCMKFRSADASPDAHSLPVQEPQGRADEELLAAPALVAQGGQGQCPPERLPCKTDQEKMCSSITIAETAGASQDMGESISPKSSEVIPPVCRRRGRSAGQSSLSTSASGTSLRLRSRSAAVNSSNRLQEPSEEVDGSLSVDSRGTDCAEEPESQSLSSESETENSSDLEWKSTTVKRKTVKSTTRRKRGDVYQQSESTALKRSSAGKSEIPKKKRRRIDPECKHDVYGALYPFERIMQKRTTADGKDWVRVKWWPCSTCGAKWRNSWESA